MQEREDGRQSHKYQRIRTKTFQNLTGSEECATEPARATLLQRGDACCRYLVSIFVHYSEIFFRQHRHKRLAAKRPCMLGDNR